MRLNQDTVRGGWIGWSWISGCVASIPAGWLLAYLAVLPAFLGLFFFMVLGLLIGAIMFRFGKSCVPVSKSHLWLMGVAVSLIVWGTTLVVEYRDFPEDVAKAVRKTFTRSFLPEEKDRFRDETREYLRSQLRTEYPPGGFVGYLRWAASDGNIECPRVFSDSTHTYRLGQRRFIWLARVVLSLVLLGGIILSQLLPLAKVAEPSNGRLSSEDACSDCEDP